MGNDIYKEIDVMENTQFSTTDDEIDRYNVQMDTFMYRISQIENVHQGFKPLIMKFSHNIKY